MGINLQHSRSDGRFFLGQCCFSWHSNRPTLATNTSEQNLRILESLHSLVGKSMNLGLVYNDFCMKLIELGISSSVDLC